ncbi:MAG: hypothetical protein A3D31_08415 [Candidatus Fluviicola riflensis]|nr:MAG: hypothetical protein CHH17_06585 [Candidatus Fluviicola riflensis]OGS79963.1 MAG: hypothetical protein A3D31_08415 [Candidatus Fluviicola riflensis]OGS82478.1 MAG: hypothetical protein A2724_17360 [Fluviicola sp. RIFCSPHIGHO2_01_FULL_43_53]OGS88142.1 MAG: hypothetical protein A3E30_14795 [Fluviicola sp. RIFCSPHIGHO2_12_FULL_43_24]
METPNIIDSKLWDKVKQSVVLILIGAVFSVVPFYFQTSAMTEQNRQTNVTQQEEINQTLIRIQNLELQGAVDDTEIKQIKESLQRIEKKIDRLIESDK